MDGRRLISVVARRDVLVSAGSAALVLTALRTGTSAQEKPVGVTLDEAMKKILGDAKPVDGKILIDLPEIAENGNTVPFALTVESPMTEADHVKALHVFAGGNPNVGIGSFYFSPASGRASVSSRMRLARTQEVVALAEMSDGRFIIARRSVKVTIGGCGG
jgi:sulfur-oxidizing protein SoxY